MTDAFALASEKIRRIAGSSEGTVQVHNNATLPNGHQVLHVSLGFSGLQQADNGLHIRAREQFLIGVPPTFPFTHPVVETPHVRFSGFPHVQWRRTLCLYQSSSDWCPEDGMYGFIKRLDAWIRDAALNRLDPDDAPLHPPVAYSTVGRLVVPRADTPVVVSEPWFGLAELRKRGARTEIVGWREHGQAPPVHFAVAVLLHKELPFEYPKTVNALLKELELHGIDYAPFVYHLALHARHNSAGSSLLVVLGAPMRRVESEGRKLQHLAVWEVLAEDADKLRNLTIAAQVGASDRWQVATEAVVKWSVEARVGWCSVRELRPEVTRRRDYTSPMSWFQGKRVAIWGCGAVGTHIAESIVRAGVRTVDLVDNKAVVPGLLARQCFDDADIGRPKAKALAERLKRIDADLEATVSTNDLIQYITGGSPLPKVDLLVDCTASSAVRTALEHALRDAESRPAIASIAIDDHATSAMATLATPNHSGCTLDLVRRLKLEACKDGKLLKTLEAFWPRSPRSEPFQPEPGCSDPTFIGSNADVAGLSARLLNSIARAVASPSDYHTGAGWLCEEAGPIHAFAWSRDHTLKDRERGYSVRVSSHASREMRGWAKRSARIAGAKVETGGIVFGELNEAAGVLWVTDVEGPPPDSHASQDHFTCGTEGLKVAAEERDRRFRGSVACVGTWHTHPVSPAHPSSVDLCAVAELLGDPVNTRRACLLLILSGNPDDPTLGAHAFETRLSSQTVIAIEQNVQATAPLGPQSERPRDIGLALSGGGSRAMAFHLGCLRALHDLDLLSRVQVISSVSGGSVISAMYAYSNSSFREFDARVVRLLRRGLQRDILAQTLTPAAAWKTARFATAIGAFCLSRVLRRLLPDSVRPKPAGRPNLPPRRGFSRTEAFRNVLAKSLFGDTLMADVARDSLHTVINATELRTGSAFRFGSKQSGCWRFGTIAPKEALVADAVAASAAYPVSLPALEREYRLEEDGRSAERKRVVLTDGGVFENLGISPLEPGRTPSISTNVFDPNYIICCDAGTGLFDDDNYPSRWPSRMRRSFLTVFRKVQDATRKRLHSHRDSGKIAGFALSYLGQQDDALPWIPAGLPRHGEVRHYPTDFAAMSMHDLDRLALRGELLTRFLVAYYLPEL